MNDHLDVPGVRENAMRAINEDTSVLERYVKVKWVLPAFLIIVVTAVSVVALFWQRSNDKDDFRDDQVALLTYLVALQAHERCEAAVDGRAAVRLLVQAIVQRNNPTPEELTEFMEFVDSVYVQPDPSKCPPEPQLPIFSSNVPLIIEELIPTTTATTIAGDG